MYKTPFLKYDHVCIQAVIPNVLSVQPSCVRAVMACNLIGRFGETVKCNSANYICTRSILGFHQTKNLRKHQSAKLQNNSRYVINVDIHTFLKCTLNKELMNFISINTEFINIQ